MPSDHPSAQPPRNARQVTLLVATRKGAWFYHGDPARGSWRTDGPHFLGHVISHVVLDPRDGRTLLAAAKTGHLGPTIFRSTDFGAHWTEAARPPAFARAEGSAGRSVDHTFWLAPGPAIEPDVWYAGNAVKLSLWHRIKRACTHDIEWVSRAACFVEMTDPAAALQAYWK